MHAVRCKIFWTNRGKICISRAGLFREIKFRCTTQWDERSISFLLQKDRYQHNFGGPLEWLRAEHRFFRLYRMPLVSDAVQRSRCLMVRIKRPPPQLSTSPVKTWPRHRLRGWIRSTESAINNKATRPLAKNRKSPGRNPSHTTSPAASIFRLHSSR